MKNYQQSIAKNKTRREYFKDEILRLGGSWKDESKITFWDNTYTNGKTELYSAYIHKNNPKNDSSYVSNPVIAEIRVWIDNERGMISMTIRDKKYKYYGPVCSFDELKDLMIKENLINIQDI